MNQKKRTRGVLYLCLTALLAATVFVLTGCGTPKLTVRYYIDGKKTEAPPEQGYYEITSIKCSNKDANATWDCNTWSLKTADLKKNTTVDLDFTYTAHPFTTNGMGYDSLQEAFNAAGAYDSATVCLTKDAEGCGISPVGSTIKLVLGGFTLTGSGNDVIVNNGTMTIVGDGAISCTGSSAFHTIVNFGKLTMNNVTVNNSTPTFTLWNSDNGESVVEMMGCTIARTEADVIPVVNSGTMTITGCTISGGGDVTHPALLNNHAKAVLTISSSTIKNTGSGYSVYKESGSITIDGSSDCPNSYGLD